MSGGGPLPNRYQTGCRASDRFVLQSWRPGVGKAKCSRKVASNGDVGAKGQPTHEAEQLVGVRVVNDWPGIYALSDLTAKGQERSERMTKIVMRICDRVTLTPPSPVKGEGENQHARGGKWRSTDRFFLPLGKRDQVWFDLPSRPHNFPPLPTAESAGAVFFASNLS
jgi:hypothetical protein